MLHIFVLYLTFSGTIFATTASSGGTTVESYKHYTSSPELFQKSLIKLADEAAQLFPLRPFSTNIASNWPVQELLKIDAVNKRDWLRIADIGTINSLLAMEAFVETLDYSFFTESDRLERALSFKEFLSKAQFHDSLETIDKYSALYAYAIDCAASQGDLHFLKILLENDVLELNPVKVNRVRQLVTKFGWAVSTKWINVRHFANSERFFWLLWATSKALKNFQTETASFLLQILKNDLAKEELFLKKLTKEMAKGKSWANLVDMTPYAPELALDAFATNCKNPDKLLQHLPKFDLSLLSSFRKKEIYRILLFSDKLEELDRKTLAILVSGLSKEEIKLLHDEKDEEDEAKCQICMDAKLECYFQCQNAETFKHGACQACYETIRNSKRPLCPWCRTPIGNMRSEPPVRYIIENIDAVRTDNGDDSVRRTWLANIQSVGGGRHRFLSRFRRHQDS